MVSAIVLNYNDKKNCIEQINRLKCCSRIDHIVVVDNNSSDNSYEELKKYASDNIRVIKTKKNGGYAYGNMVGAYYVHNKFSDEYIVFANPDTIFDDKNITDMIAALKKYDDLACVSPIMLVNGRLDTIKYPVAFKKKSVFEEILDVEPISRRLFHNILHYTKKDIFNINTDIVFVYAITGSLMMFKKDIFLKVGGFDSHTFLYEEEKIIGYKLDAYGYKCGILTGSFYHHFNSVSIDKVYSNKSKQKIRRNSSMYYLKNYLHANCIQLKIADVVFKLVDLENYVYSKLIRKRKND